MTLRSFREKTNKIKQLPQKMGKNIKIVTFDTAEEKEWAEFIK